MTGSSLLPTASIPPQLGFRVAELVNSFVCRAIFESLDDFRYAADPKVDLRRNTSAVPLIFVLIFSLALLAQSSAFAQDSSATLRDIRAARDGGKIQSAAQMLIQLDDQSESDLSLDLVLLARSAKGQLDKSEIDELYLRAAESLSRSELVPESVGQRLLLRGAVANHFAACDENRLVTEILLQAFREIKSDDALQIDNRHVQPLVKLAMMTAWKNLNGNQPVEAENLYSAIIDLAGRPKWSHVVGTDQSLAMLGLGWATAIQPDRMQLAAERLQQFIDAFGDHEDAPKAAAMRIKCLQQSDQVADAESAIAAYLKRWPKTQIADGIVNETLASHTPSDTSPLRLALEQWIVEDGLPGNWSPELAGRALLFTGARLPAPRFDALLKRLAGGDETGQRVAVLLHDSVELDNHGFAEQIAATLISGDLTDSTPMARESACRWAGRTGRWSMLALAAESTNIDQDDDQRTPHVDRLFAEALTQTGRAATACRWWAHVVDHHGATDFATLLRCAESAVAHADITEAARRLEAAERALASNGEPKSSVQTALVNLLAADLAVRQVDFAGARALFEKVVRSPNATPTLRGRAQWMIGETYFMQHQFAKAIGEYRNVEGLDPGGPFVAASLVQAGKSFEQLGLTREAGDCYSALLGRFAGSVHAKEARRRMAVLPSLRR